MHPQNIIGVGNPLSWSGGLNGIIKGSNVFWKPSGETGQYLFIYRIGEHAQEELVA